MVKTNNSKIRLVLILALAGILTFLFGISQNLEAQYEKVDLNSLVNETQKSTSGADDMILVWWIPEEFWLVSFAQDPTVSKNEAQEFIKVLKPYVVVAVVEGKIGSFGGVTYKSEDDTRSRMKIKDKYGNIYSPLSYDKIDPQTKNLLSMIKPVIVNMLGSMGQNMHFVLFPSKNKSNEPIVNPTLSGDFTILLSPNEFKWKLPLGSLLPPKICAKCGEKCSGAWSFCPWCGTKLQK